MGEIIFPPTNIVGGRFCLFLQFPDQVVRHVTPLTALQVRILELLDLSPDIYRSLAANST